MKPILVFLVFFFIFPLSYSQRIAFEFQTGVGFYGINTLKQVNNSVLSTFGSDAKVSKDFPPYVYYQSSFSFRGEDFSLGLLYSGYTSGTRIMARDNNGKYRFETKIRSKAPGLILIVFSKKPTKVKTNVYCKAGAAFSILNFDEVMQTDSQNFYEDNTIESNNYFFEPGLQLAYPVCEWFNISLNIGYFKEFESKDFNLKSVRNSLIVVDNDFLKGNGWERIRFGLSCSICL